MPSANAPSPSGRWSRVLLYGGAAAVAGWILWRMFYPDYLTNRCAELGYQAVIAESQGSAALRPSDAAWYAEHCWEGRPRP